LGACVQIQAIESHYVWQGQQAQTAEWLLSIKTRSVLYDELERFIRARHHYETPQLLCTPVLAGQAAYLAWIRQETQAQGQQA
jgi:periplasmic divalent cation tolerance protein